MSTTIEIENTEPFHGTSTITPGIGSRTAVLIYSIAAYVVGMTGLMWLILAMGRLMPYGFGPVHAQSTVTALLIDLGFIFLFGLQHSVMARRSFKEKLLKVLPQAAERATFVLASGLVMGLLVWCWQPLPGMVWSVETPSVRRILTGLYLAGWSYLVVSTFVTNHFELFGLRQAYLHFCGIPHTPVRFINKWMYSYSRHPMMLGVLVGMWAIADMSTTHFVLSLFMSGYIVIGVLFEERELVHQFGDIYREYRRKIGTFFTFTKLN